MTQSSQRVGIIGGGQLALFLGQAARKHGHDVTVFVARNDEPAALEFPSVIGSLVDAPSVTEFLKRCDIVTFENEFIDVGALESALKNSKVHIAPSLKAIRSLQQKKVQKSLFLKCGIPTASFDEWNHNTLSVSQWLDSVLKKFRGRAVLKWNTGGYDGKGVFMLNPSTTEGAQEFCAQARKRQSSVYAEEHVDFVRELAMVAVATHNHVECYPLVVSQQKEGICRTVMGPARLCGVRMELEEEALRYCQALAKEVELRGTFALEFFETKDGTLLVNEAAPRVHNSGHYSLNASTVSQFENHWNALLHNRFETPVHQGGFAMVNLIGPKDLPPKPSHEPDWPLTKNIFPHWYYKKEIRSGRKMGHINGVMPQKNPTKQEIELFAKQLELMKTEWERSVR